MADAEDRRPKCDNCGKPTSTGFDLGKGKHLPMCINCQTLYWNNQTQAQESRMRLANFYHDAIYASVGLPPSRARFQLPERAITMNSLNISHSNVGVVNTGTIGRVERAVGQIQNSGQPKLAAAFARLAEAVINAPDASAEQKQEIAEALSVLSRDAALPDEDRSKSTMRKVLEDTATTLGAIASLSTLVEQVYPVIAAAFR